MTDYAKVVDAPGLVRDPHSKAIIAQDSSALAEHRKKRAMMASLLNKNKSLENEVKQLSDRLTSMETLLERIILKLEE
jgi:hypothetical protein